MRAVLGSWLAFLGVAIVPLAHASSAELQPALPFIQDDYPRALAEAKARNLLLFVDAWAPWCHTCRSMKAYVFTDRSLTELAHRCVWLEIDTEKDSNAGFVERFPIDAWPTLFVIDPRTETVLMRRLGSATVAQLGEMVADGERALVATEQGWRAAIARADRLYGEGKASEAAEAYAVAVPDAPAAWDGRGRAVESYLMALSLSDQARRCAQTARDEYPALRNTPAAVTAVSVGLDCAVSLGAADAERPGLIQVIETLARQAITLRGAAVAADDVSAVYLSLHAAREDAKDEAGARAVAAEWARFLDEEAARAPSAEARAVFDSHRLTAALALGQAERAIAMLQASERELPDDYNPPARLALAYKAAKRYDEALAASDRALAKIHGPRRVTVLHQRAEILGAKGDRGGARKALEDALACAQAQPITARRQRTIETLHAELSEINREVE